MHDAFDYAALQREGAFYVFDTRALNRRVARLREALGPDVALCYAVKANPFLVREAAGNVERFEICSPGEWEICQALGLPSERAVISGVVKAEAFIQRLVADADFHGILTVESPRQYAQICRAAETCHRTARVLVRLTNGSSAMFTGFVKGGDQA